MGDVKQVNLADISDGGLVEKPVAAAPAAEKAVKAVKAPKEKKEKKKSSGGGLTLSEVAKHVTKDDCWVVVNGRVLNVTKFLPEHPGGELAIMTFAGKDATEEFNMLHPPDVIDKYAPDAVLGPLGTGGESGGG